MWIVRIINFQLDLVFSVWSSCSNKDRILISLGLLIKHLDLKTVGLLNFVISTCRLKRLGNNNI